ncbi:13687_t:CDS:2 [Ambispora gerdemannii]|uniref:13687_t:CDS:1 n=1 Tax=Ambispora gerdemannii TaxID=144530 RepID=A0A9N9FAM6_9GLOM|nr:13687_t:CDS:2 [Ambispora gerdemannii]
MQTPFESRLAEGYDRALNLGELLFLESTVVKIKENDVEFEVRFAPSLYKKPLGNLVTAENSNVRSKVDPFTFYNPALLVEEYGNSYIVLMNKFVIVPHHILVVTKEFEKQTDPLFPRDLAAVWHYLVQFESRKPLAFYNCGNNSGASQPHKHIQILPLPNDPPIDAYFNDVDRKSDEIFDFPQFSYIHHVIILNQEKIIGSSEETIGEYLSETYHSLYDAMIESLRTRSDNNASANLVFPISYNFLMTTSWMIIVPRTCEKFRQVSVNSLGFGGMMLVKSEEELELVKSVGVIRILDAVTVPKESGGLDRDHA